MSIVLLVYLASIVDQLKSVIGVICFVGIPIFLFFLVVFMLDYKKTFAQCHGKKFTTLFILLVLLNIAIPNEKTIYILAGASIAQDIANSPKTAATLDKVYKIIEKKLDEQLEEGIDKAVKKAEKKLEEVK